MDNIKAIIFDLDNTLLDRISTFGNFTTNFLSNYFSHLESTEDLHNRIIELDEDGYKDKRILFSELLEELPWQLKPNVDELMAFYSKEYIKSAVLMNQSIDVIRNARNKYKTGLITNGQTLIQYGKIDQLGIRNEFDMIIVSEEAGVKKPNPTIFEMALQKLQLNAEECIYVGDHPVNDIEGAAGIGMHTIWIKVNQPWREDLKVKPLYSLNHVSELLQLL